MSTSSNNLIIPNLLIGFKTSSKETFSLVIFYLPIWKEKYPFEYSYTAYSKRYSINAY